MVSKLWTITLILLVLWGIGFAINIGAWIHFFLVVAAITFIYMLIYSVDEQRRNKRKRQEEVLEGHD